MLPAEGKFVELVHIVFVPVLQLFVSMGMGMVRVSCDGLAVGCGDGFPRSVGGRSVFCVHSCFEWYVFVGVILFVIVGFRGVEIDPFVAGQCFGAASHGVLARRLAVVVL